MSPGGLRFLGRRSGMKPRPGKDLAYYQVIGLE